jgi:ribosome-binding protein aMBF1 (putative translation factor)
MTITITGQQVKAARLLLGWSREMLAGEADVDTRTVANFEAGNAQPLVRSVRKIQRVLEAAGVEFVEAEPGAGTIAIPRIPDGPSL